MDTVPISTDVAWRTDALQAVKLDPAVLEAQITVDGHINKPNARPGPAVSSDIEHHTLKKPIEQCSVPVSPQSMKFEDIMKMQKAALLSLAPQQFDLLLKYAEILRMQRLLNQKHLECAFCKNNGEPASWYSLHVLKDNRGRVRCPVLRGYRCRGCGATGDAAHTIKYCPLSDRDRWSC